MYSQRREDDPETYRWKTMDLPQVGSQEIKNLWSKFNKQSVSLIPQCEFKE